MLGEESIRTAVNHLVAFGDTDIFPALPELRFFGEKIDEVVKILSKLTPGDYIPSTAQEFLVPKSSNSFRIAHQLTSQDTLIYLASVLDNAEEIEGMRTPADEGVAFSYRYLKGIGPKIFDPECSYHDWLEKITDFGGVIVPQNDKRVVVETDISDFFQRIYFHRIENILDNCSKRHASSITKKIVKTVRANQSFGIPVGQSASRMLAEAVLNDTDKFLLDQGLAVTRFVDDFRIIAEGEAEAHAALCQLAEHLMVTEGLSLNGAKTAFTSVGAMQDEAVRSLEDMSGSGDLRKMLRSIRVHYGDDLTDDDTEDDIAEFPFSDANDILEKMDKLEDEYPSDISVYKAMLRAIKVMGGADPDHIMKYANRFFYIIPRDYCLAISSSSTEDDSKVNKTRMKLLSYLKTSPYCDLEICRYWILSVFIKSNFNVSEKDFRGYDFNRSISERRCHHLLKAKLGDVSYFRQRKARFNDLSDWEKPAFMMGAMVLPRDEYEKWLTGIRSFSPGPLGGLYCDWLKEKWGSLPELLT
ncbi:hypothetical protein FHR22_001151 [Sphingopyxis panaciterrae]|uniref:RNA-directed DNA polymerase n=1 Tax=Sphingopyxis panaciterrae TaxID=363841 RepID=UPI001421A094|nr:RNA-directed DNA polymerase [Sphingopyxis panaciterrae]NIJ36502.1 hypothetical protein [Sphingopyxis panaciterrae]